MRSEELVAKAFSDGVSVEKIGPQLTKGYRSECVLRSGGNSYVTAATFAPKWAAEHFVTTLTVGNELKYFESVAFGRRTVMRDFSETINAFSKDKTYKHRTRFLFDPRATKRRYFAGIELLPAQKLVVIGELNGSGDATECGEKSVINGDINGYLLMNGRDHLM